jgi:hypothetical protein
MAGTLSLCPPYARSGAPTTPLVAAKAGTQFLALDSSLRGNERIML